MYIVHLFIFNVRCFLHHILIHHKIRMYFVIIHLSLHLIAKSILFPFSGVSRESSRVQQGLDPREVVLAINM